MQRLLPLALAALTLAAALPAHGAADGAAFGHRIPADKLATTLVTLGVTPDGDFFAITNDIAQIGPFNPGRLDACVSQGAVMPTCTGLTAHTGPPLGFAITGLATSFQVPGFASVSAHFNTGTTTTFRCDWTGATPNGIYGLFVVAGAPPVPCRYTSIGSGSSWTLSGAQSEDNIGALAHVSF